MMTAIVGEMSLLGEVVLVWAGLSAVFAGVGLLLRSCFRPGPVRGQDVLLAPWLGWGCGIVLLQLWHFWSPVDWRALAGIAVLGFVGLVLNRKGVIEVCRRAGGQVFPLAGMILLAAIWLANQSTTQVGLYDSGFYHLSVVKWNSEFPIVPGLANLCSYFGYNNVHLLYAAMLNVGPFADRYHHVASGLLILWGLIRSMAGCWCYLRDGARAELSRVFDAVLLVPLVAFALNTGYPANVYAEVPVFLLVAVIASELLRALAYAKGEESRAVPKLLRGRDEMRRIVYRYTSVVFLCCVAVTVKASVIGFAAMAGLGMLFAVAAPCSGWRFRARLAGVGALVAVLTVAPWVVGNIVLTGYAVFPFVFSGLPVDWKVPYADVVCAASWLKAWARLPSADCDPSRVLADWHWFLPWLSTALRTFKADTVVPLCVGACGLVLLGLERKSRPLPGLWPWSFFLVPAGGLLFWFFTCPDVRYVAGVFWVLGAAGLAFYLWGQERSRGLAVWCAVSVLLLAHNVNPMEFFHVWQKDASVLKTVPMVKRTTQSGMAVYVPAKGIQCWNSPLPCTPFFNPELTLRVEGQMERGFRVRVGSEGE